MSLLSTLGNILVRKRDIVSADSEATRSAHIKSREKISSFFVSVLIGIAIHEMIDPVKSGLVPGFSATTFMLASIFLLNSMRFFIGNQLHLLSDSLDKMSGRVWMFDLFFITVEMVLIDFLGGLTSVPTSSNSSIGFMELLMGLYVVDVVWIVLMWMLSIKCDKWKRSLIPLEWLIMNTVLIGIMVLFSIGFSLNLKFLFDSGFSPYSFNYLLFMVFINIVAFAYDVFVTDHYKLLD